MHLRSGRQLTYNARTTNESNSQGGYSSIELELILYLHEKSEHLKQMDCFKFTTLFDSVYLVLENTIELYSTLTEYFTYIKDNPKFTSFLKKMYKKSVTILKNIEKMKVEIEQYPNTKTKKRIIKTIIYDIEECENVIHQWQYHYPC